MAETANRSRGSGRRVRGAFAPEAAMRVPQPDNLSSILATADCRDRSRLKRSAFICELSVEMEQCIPAPDDSSCRMDDLALRTAINDFLGKLDEEKRNMFVRRYWFLDSVADIAKRYGISESKVKTTLFRCRNRLREHLNKEGYTV